MSPHVAWCRSRVPLNQPLHITFPKNTIFGGNTHDSPMLLHVESDFIILHLYIPALPLYPDSAFIFTFVETLPSPFRVSGQLTCWKSRKPPQRRARH